MRKRPWACIIGDDLRCGMVCTIVFAGMVDNSSRIEAVVVVMCETDSCFVTSPY